MPIVMHGTVLNANTRIMSCADPDLENEVLTLLQAGGMQQLYREPSVPSPSSAPLQRRRPKQIVRPASSGVDRAEAQHAKSKVWEKRSAYLGPPRAHTPNIFTRPAGRLSDSSRRATSATALDASGVHRLFSSIAHAHSLPVPGSSSSSVPDLAASPSTSAERAWAGELVAREYAIHRLRQDDQKLQRRMDALMASADLGEGQGQLRPKTAVYGRPPPDTLSFSPSTASLAAASAASAAPPDMELPSLVPSAGEGRPPPPQPPPPIGSATGATEAAIARYARTMGSAGELRSLKVEARRKAERKEMARQDSSLAVRKQAASKQAVAAWRRREQEETEAWLRTSSGNPRWQEGTTRPELSTVRRQAATKQAIAAWRQQKDEEIEAWLRVPGNRQLLEV